MKKLFLVLVIFLMLSIPVSAGVHLAWDANTEPDLLGYVIYFQDTADSEMYNYDVGNVTDFLLDCTVPGHSYDIHLKAYNAIGLSGESNHVQWTEPATFTPPANYLPSNVVAPGVPLNAGIL